MWKQLLPTLLLAASAASAEPLAVKLNGPLPPGDFAVRTFLLTSDGGHVVFGVGPRNLGLVSGAELFSVPTAGGEVTRLHPPVDGGFAEFFQLSPDGSRVVFSARFGPTGSTAMWSVPVTGGEPTRLATALSTRARISPDSQRVVYSKPDFQFPPAGGLFSVPIGGGDEIQLNEPVLAGRFLFPGDFAIAPDARVVYVTSIFDLELEGAVGKGLHSVSGGGGPVTTLFELPTSPSDFDEPGLGDVDITPDGSRVLFRANAAQGTPASVDLYSVPISGGPVIQLNPPLAGRDRFVSTFGFSSDGSRMVYWADQDRSEVDLYSVPVDGGAATRLNDTPFFPDSSRTRLVPDGRIVYFSSGAFRVVSLEGGPSLPLTPELPPSVHFLVVSPDSRWLLFWWPSFGAVPASRLQIVPLAGGPPRMLSPPLVSGGEIPFGARFTPDATRVVYCADQEQDGRFELYSVPVGGGVVSKLHPTPAAGTRLSCFLAITADGRRVVYSIDHDQPGVRELYSSPLPPIVEIDIEPGRGSAVFRPQSRRFVSVAILGSETLDVEDIAIDTIAFGPSGAAAAKRPKRVDVNRDGFADLLTRYRSDETGLAGGDTEACLSGFDGTFEFFACDAITIATP